MGAQRAKGLGARLVAAQEWAKGLATVVAGRVVAAARASGSPQVTGSAAVRVMGSTVAVGAPAVAGRVVAVLAVAAATAAGLAVVGRVVAAATAEGLAVEEGLAATVISARPVEVAAAAAVQTAPRR